VQQSAFQIQEPARNFANQLPDREALADFFLAASGTKIAHHLRFAISATWISDYLVDQLTVAMLASQTSFTRAAIVRV
jgi:hypothetical protein